MQFQMKDLMGVAGATIGIVIAISIFLSNLTSKYIAIFGRYNALCGELRGQDPSQGRQASVREQIEIFRRRLQATRRASSVLAVGLIAFICSVVCASLGVILQDPPALKVVGMITLGFGFLTMIIAAILELFENDLSKHVIELELGDIRATEAAGRRQPRPGQLQREPAN